MKSIVVYESMFGNTHAAAEHIAASLDELGEVRVMATKDISAADVGEVQLLVVGGPTHRHGMTSKSSRKAAAQTAAEDPSLDLDDDFGGPGLREWIRDLPNGYGRFCAAFDTRTDGWEIVTGSAARGISRRLVHRGYEELVEHESFVLGDDEALSDDEADRAGAWGHALAKRCKALNIV